MPDISDLKNISAIKEVCKKCDFSMFLNDGCYVCGKSIDVGEIPIINKDEAINVVPYGCAFQMEIIVLGEKHEN